MTRLLLAATAVVGMIGSDSARGEEHRRLAVAILCAEGAKDDARVLAELLDRERFEVVKIGVARKQVALPQIMAKREFAKEAHEIGRMLAVESRKRVLKASSKYDLVVVLTAGAMGAEAPMPGLSGVEAGERGSERAAPSTRSLRSAAGGRRKPRALNEVSAVGLLAPFNRTSIGDSSENDFFEAFGLSLKSDRKLSGPWRAGGNFQFFRYPDTGTNQYGLNGTVGYDQATAGAGMSLATGAGESLYGFGFLGQFDHPVWKERRWSLGISAGYALSVFFFEGQSVLVHLLTAGLGAGYRF